MDNGTTYSRDIPYSRIHTIDFLRAFALLGILLAHAHDHFNCYVYPPEAGGLAPFLNSISDWVHRHLLTGKAFMLFSFLFGVSFFIQMDRASSRGIDFGRRFVWRLALLFILGAVHTVFYDGDILTMFALQGLLLIPFYRCKPRTLLITGLVCVICLPGLLHLVKVIFNAPYIFSYLWENSGGSRDEVFMEGSFLQVTEWNILFGQTSKWKYLVESGRIGQTFGLFLLGLYTGKSRFFENIVASQPIFKKTMLVCLPAWLALWILVSSYDLAFLVPFCNLCFTLSVVCGIPLLLMGPHSELPVRLLTPVGRMTLTAYVSQSVFFCFFFYGWGLGMARELGYFSSMVAAFLFFMFQVAAARLWLSKYRYGPLEWLWRTGTYMSPQPFKK